jgi:hypothetical protein
MPVYGILARAWAVGGGASENEKAMIQPSLITDMTKVVAQSLPLPQAKPFCICGR